jgi:RimJ/RimL family protein N-acetyltransferase
MWSTRWRRRRGRRALALPIVTDRLVLRDFVDGDFDAVLAYASDPEATRLMFYGPRDGDATRAYLAHLLSTQAERPRLTWELAVVERGGDRVIGSCDLTLSNEREGDLGYIFARSSWGRGFATEAARAMVRGGFEQLALDRIFAMCDVSHDASRRVLEKAGLRAKGVVEGARQAKGRSWDMWLYELLRDEWLAAATTATASSPGRSRDRGR